MLPCPGCPDEPEQAADDDRHRARVEAEERSPAVRVVELHLTNLEHRHRGETERDPELYAAAQDDEEQRRPHEVELLLGGERPQVLECERHIETYPAAMSMFAE